MVETSARAWLEASRAATVPPTARSERTVIWITSTAIWRTGSTPRGVEAGVGHVEPGADGEFQARDRAPHARVQGGARGGARDRDAHGAPVANGGADLEDGALGNRAPGEVAAIL